MNGNNYHTMSVICDNSLGWIYRELMKEIKILELLSDAEFFCEFFQVNFIFSIAALIHCSANRGMCHNVSDQKSYTIGIIKRSYVPNLS